MFKRFCLILSLAIGMVFPAVLPALAESVDIAWVKRYNGPGNDYDGGNAIAVDGSGNVYVTGCSAGSATGADYLTIKYYLDGDTAWARRYNGPGNWGDEAVAVAVDGSGSVYITGYSEGIGTSNDYATVKYYPNGDTAWVRRHDGSDNYWDWANAIAVDDSGNVYVTGESWYTETFPDYTTIKYHPEGDTAWLRRYNGPGNNLDGASAVAVDDSNNVYLTGWSWGGSTQHDYATVKYFSEGDTAWTRRYNGPTNSWDLACAIAVDGACNVYVTGTSDQTAPGYSVPGDYVTIKYGSSGSELWVKRYHGPGDSTDKACDIAVDGSGNVYVTGESFASGLHQDYATIKYYPDGDTAWVRRYNGLADSIDVATAISLDTCGNTYVTGYSWNGTDYDYVTIKYDSSGNELWVERYDGPGSGDDKAWDIAVCGCGNVYVTGESYGSGTDYDYATIGYVQGISYVSIIDLAFVPQADTISVGDSVRWTNNGAVPHTSTSDTKSLWDSGTLDPGESFTFQFEGSGLFPYHCTFHPSMAGTIVVLTTDVKEETGTREKPSEYTLSENYPNPFNQATKIEFTLAKSGFVSLNIYDIVGRKVRSLISGKVSSGYKSVLWDGKNDSGKDVASGIYFYQIKVGDPASGGIGDFTETKKLVLLK